MGAQISFGCYSGVAIFLVGYKFHFGCNHYFLRGHKFLFLGGINFHLSVYKGSYFVMELVGWASYFLKSKEV